MTAERMSTVVLFVRRVLDWLARLGRRRYRAAGGGRAGNAIPPPPAGCGGMVSIGAPADSLLTQPEETAEPADVDLRAAQDPAAAAPRGFSVLGSSERSEAREHAAPASDLDTRHPLPPEPAAGGSANPALPPSEPPASWQGGGSDASPDRSPPLEAPKPPSLGEDTDETGSERRPELGSDDTPRHATETKSRRISPASRGGRPRSLTSEENREAGSRTRSHPRRPDITCWKCDGEWVVGIEISDTHPSPNISVRQAETLLAEDSFRTGCWPLARLDTPVMVHDRGSDTQWTLEVGDQQWLLFKLGGPKLEQGRRVKRPVSGLYLAIVPAGWSRDDERAGRAPTSPEPVHGGEYQAQFFDLNEAASHCIALRDQLGRSVTIDAGGPQFHLVGHAVPDATGRIGPLFGGELPRLGIVNGDWSAVQTIVVGQEGGGQQRWRTSFPPHRERVDQELPREILERRVGWYFVRFYDFDDRLLDSLDFRFVAGLREISVPARSLVPPTEEGHLPTTITILHEAGYRVTPSDDGCPDIRLEGDREKTIIEVPRSPECDRSEWTIRTQGGDGEGVPITLLIERLWWGVGTDVRSPGEWTDRPIPLVSGDFAATSDKAIWLRLSRARWLGNVAVGYRREDAREYYVRVAQRDVPIPLRDFAGTQELDDPAAPRELKVWLPTEGGPQEGTIGLLAVEEPRSALDATTITAHRLATILTRLRRATDGAPRQAIKEVRRTYRRGAGSRRGRNSDFVKKALCLIAVLLDDATEGRRVRAHVSGDWRAKVELARREYPEFVRQLKARLKDLRTR
jgi:hypothetical protein